MVNVICGILAGPNSSILIKKLIKISEKLSNNKITWYICEDIGYSKKKFLNNENNFSELKNISNIYFTNPMTNSEITSGGDRHGMGVDILIRHLKNEEKMIILEPDSFPCCFGWDDIILSKINSEHPIVTFCFEKYFNENLEVDIEKTKSFKNWHTPLSGDLGFIGINPKIFANLNITFMKIKYFNDSVINKKLENTGKGRTLLIENNELSKLFELPLNTNMQKEWGWRIAYPLKEEGYTSFKFKMCPFQNEKIYDLPHPMDLLYDNNNNLFGLHLHYSRYFSSSILKSYRDSFEQIFNNYKINKLIIELFKEIF